MPDDAQTTADQDASDDPQVRAVVDTVTALNRDTPVEEVRRHAEAAVKELSQHRITGFTVPLATHQVRDEIRAEHDAPEQP